MFNENELLNLKKINKGKGIKEKKYQTKSRLRGPKKNSSQEKTGFTYTYVFEGWDRVKNDAAEVQFDRLVYEAPPQEPIVVMYVSPLTRNCHAFFVHCPLLAVKVENSLIFPKKLRHEI